MRQILLVVLGVAFAITLIIGFSTLNQANQQQLDLVSRLQSRTQVLAESLAESIEPPFASHATTSVQSVVDRISSNERIDGLAVVGSDGQTIAASKAFPKELLAAKDNTEVMDADEAQGSFVTIANEKEYIYITPLHYEDRVIGALLIEQSASYIDDAVASTWRESLVPLFLQLCIVLAGVFVLVRFVFYRELLQFSESIRAVRRGDTDLVGTKSNLFDPLSSEISKMSHSLKAARHAASEEARLRLEKIDSPWTAERLKEFMKAYLKGRPLYVVSNREPYVHSKGKSGITYSVPAGGVITALEPVMEACGGMWIAHGSGDADKQVVNEEDEIAVPPEEPKYTLKRVWLTDEEVKGYYNGFANEALWPLCLMVHTRPIFREEDWKEYRKVNGLFAKTLLAEIRNVERPLILVQDYHLALLPEMIKKSRPDAQVAIFWHIPWPNPAQFSICPWREEILEGLLSADLIGFHTQQHCNNFIDTVASELEARIDLERFSITHADHETYIKPFPISIAFPQPHPSHAHEEGKREALAKLGIETEFVGIGVDRLDYTKGILERFKGIEFFLQDNPEYKERFTFLQIAAPSRETIEKYREYAEAVSSEAERINERFATRSWKPIVLERKHYSHQELEPLYREADMCLITSLHDGMNLVAKEFVAAREDDSGVLVLSQFTGAARDLKGALVVNPYSAEEMSAAIRQALTMSLVEQHQRMKAMRGAVRDYNIYRWSAEFIKALAQLG